jgi:hypothetical protein
MHGAVEMSVITGYGSLNALQDSLTSLLCDVRDLRAGKLPRSIDLRVAPIVDKWSYGLVPARCLVGSVSGHPILGNLAGTRPSLSSLIRSVVGREHGPVTIGLESPKGRLPAQRACNRISERPASGPSGGFKDACVASIIRVIACPRFQLRADRF